MIMLYSTTLGNLSYNYIFSSILCCPLSIRYLLGLNPIDLSLLLASDGENGLMFKNHNMDSESGDDLPCTV